MLKLEEPKSIKFKLYNLSPNAMKIQLSVKEKEVSDLLICGISKYVSFHIILFVESRKIRTLVKCGVQFGSVSKELWGASCQWVTD